MLVATRRLCVLTLLSLAALTSTGCETVGFIAEGIAGGPSQVNVTAEYLGLQDQTVAVLVNTDRNILMRYPQAPLEVGAALSNNLAANVPGIQIVDPRRCYDYTVRNIYWSVDRTSHVARQLGVTRLVVVELNEYQTTEPGNNTVYQGLISTSVFVAEADGPTPDDFIYETLSQISYPKEPIPVPDIQEVTIRKGMLDRFAETVGPKFYDHTQER